MIDRVPTKVLQNGAIRYGVYDEAGNFLRYEYMKLEDEPTQQGTPINKANLLSDATEASIWGSAANRTVNSALAKIDSDIKVKPFVVGVYTGNGSYPSSQSISLGFTPSAVIAVSGGYRFVEAGGRVYGGLAINGYPVVSSGSAKGIEITSGGFTVYNNTGSSGYDAACNISGVLYHYIAFR